MLPFPDTSTIVALLISVSLSFISAVMWRAGASRADSSSVVRTCAFWGFAASATAVLLLLMVLVGEIPDARPWLRAAVALAAPVFACLAAAKRVTLTWFGVSLALFSVLLWTAVVVLHQHNWLSPYPQ
ncbi:hypothetical protein FH969_07810 [Miniimonas arenae]|uniref:Uncharacterized protein n=1 Tax=Miniimonas arenae TaxID=676201 RepID=A0A5C5BCD8_9MICO|nr:hypothetical protein [Miniimonas arenae]TNU74721.1 hypothetical protein FH969_07810 [Miniimonas arenae]